MPVPTKTKPDLSKIRIKCEKGYVEPHQLKWLRETSSTESIEELRKRYNEDGYVFIKGMLDREKVLALREAYFKFLGPLNLVAPGKEREGILHREIDTQEFPVIGSPQFPLDKRPKTLSTYQRLLEESQRLPEYLDLIHSDEFKEFIRQFAQWDDIHLLERALFRLNLPGSPAAGIHYDYMFLRANDEDCVTAWIPIGDIHPNGSALIYLEDSVGLGREKENEWHEAAKNLTEKERLSAYNATMTLGARVASDCSEYAEQTGRTWMVGNYEAGDVVLHNAYMIHCAPPNVDPNNTIRVATDIRFVNPKSKMDPRWTHVWFVGDTDSTAQAPPQVEPASETV